MQDTTKKQLLESAKQHISIIRKKIMDVLAHKEEQTTRMSKESIRMLPGDAIAQRRIVAHNQERIENLKQLYPSPYFTKCEFEVNGENKIFYFSKFSFSEEHIYSWITPAATLRFEDPGEASYTRPDGSIQSGKLLSKDQYMIVDGTLLFYSTESIDHPRELIHQEHFTRHKEGFILPEVVEQMEKAQDKVVRAHYQGPFVISGPAGSGKTTLALHRVAYLAQSPETAEYFSPEKVIVLVQDMGTKEYFSHLLPELGIRGFSIQTFAEWAMEILQLKEMSFCSRYGNSENEQLQYEWEKLSALRTMDDLSYYKNIYAILQKIYLPRMSVAMQKVWKKQREEKMLDRIDLTILLTAYYKTKGKFLIEKEFYEELANGNYRKKKGSFPVQYNLMVIDEFQNYLPEQLGVMRNCLNHRLDSIVYVGDFAQQTQLGTIRAWSEIGEAVRSDRLVTLEKVYRNTKQILNYIKSLGYSVTIPNEIKSGKEVVDKLASNAQEEIRYIQNEIANLREGETAGILSKEASYLADFKQVFGQQKNVLCLSFQEAQGVEFDKVFIVGVYKEMFDNKLDGEIAAQVNKIHKDLLYVALTRAMTELHIFGTCHLNEAVTDPFV